MSKPSKEPAPVTWESGLEIEPVYGPEQLERSGGTKDVGEPGEYP